MVAASLRALGDVSFAEAASGLEAVERLAMGPTAMMILDLTMPDMHGLDVLRFVRRHPTYQALPVIVLTTRDDPASRRAAMEAGATMYLTKPFVPDALASHARLGEDVDAELLRDRGVLRARLGDTTGAREDFEAGLAAVRQGDPPELVDDLRRRLSEPTP